MIWFGVAGTGGVAWYGMVWHGMVWHGMVAFHPCCGLHFPTNTIDPSVVRQNTPGGGEVSLQLEELVIVEAQLK